MLTTNTDKKSTVEQAKFISWCIAKGIGISLAVFCACVILCTVATLIGMGLGKLFHVDWDIALFVTMIIVMPLLMAYLVYKIKTHDN